MNNNETVRETLNRVVRELGAIKDNSNTTPYPSAGYTPYVQTGNPLWAQRQCMTAIQPAQNQPLRPLSNKAYHNRYKKGCSPYNIAYNTLSNYQVSPNYKIFNSGNALIDGVANFAVSQIPFIKYFSKGANLANTGVNIYNALDEADCFK